MKPPTTDTGDDLHEPSPASLLPNAPEADEPQDHKVPSLLSATDTSAPDIAILHHDLQLFG